ncbi:hypothetical protein DFH09DRAFT_880931, partial [Mycena vulgaris]
RTVLSALRRFPPELMSEIFPENSRASKSYSITDPREAPLVLGRVCSLWRTIMHHTPCLWD